MSLRHSYDVGFVSFKATGSSVMDYQFRILGRDRRLNGTLTLTEDVGGEHFSEEFQTYIDSSGSGEYKLLPFSLPRQPVCEAIESYWRYFAASVKFGENTNGPFGNDTCPLLKGHYFFKDIIINSDDWPLVMPRGQFKTIITFRKDEDIVCVLEIVCLIENKIN
ncbi:uncharacterized protein LOC108045923 [Drosophila rhopaloa]|uniref:Uncharacterized protein n=1 Tax=Drosophila rhopaloa TaxID=1041015 RepID=A0ABM5HIJ6_DRORH|nr:uncharacterized protein LOC108045923 [Drosophila rhopaloa]